MSKLTLGLLGVVLALLAVGVALLAMWDIPPPSQPVEKEIPVERPAR